MIRNISFAFAILVLLGLARTANAQQLYRPLDSIKYFVPEIAFSPDGSLFSVIEQTESDPDARSTVYLYQASSEKRVARFTLDKGASWAAFSPDNRTLMLGDESALRLTGPVKGSTVFRVDISDLNNIRIIHRDDLEDVHINAGAFSPDGRYYAYGSDNGQVLVFNTQTNELAFKALYSFPLVDVEFFSDDVIAATAQETKELTLYRISTREILAKIPSPADYYIGTIRNGYKGERFMFPSDGKAYLFDMKSTKPLGHLRAGMYPDRRPKRMDVVIAPNADFMAKIGEDRLTLYTKNLKEGGYIKFTPYPDDKRAFHRFWSLAIGDRTKVAFILNKVLYCGNYSDFLALSKK